MQMEDMSMTHIPTYISRVVPVPARVGPVVLERWWSETRSRSAGSRFETVEVDLGRLMLDPATWEQSSLGPAGPHRRVFGKLSAPGHRAWPVELELTPWSLGSSELGLRFAGRRFPSASGLIRYHPLAAAVLDAIGSSLLELYPAELTEEDLRRPNAA